jgi:hypothetical protein
VTRTLIGNKVYDGQTYVAAAEAAGENVLPVMLMPPARGISIWNVTLPSVMRSIAFPAMESIATTTPTGTRMGWAAKASVNAEAPKQAG